MFGLFRKRHDPANLVANLRPSYARAAGAIADVAGPFLYVVVLALVRVASALALTTLAFAGGTPTSGCGEANLGEAVGDYVCGYGDHEFRWKASSCIRPDPDFVGHYDREQYRICVAREGERQRTLFRIASRAVPTPRPGAIQRHEMLEELAATGGVPLWFYGAVAFFLVCIGVAILVKVLRAKG